MTRTAPPTRRVLSAFGLVDEPEPERGGRGTSWRVGAAVLKPDVHPRFQEWLGSDLSAVSQSGFRLPEVLQARDGRWVVHGWAAQVVFPGRAVEGPDADWPAVIEAGRAFHQAVSSIPRPDFLDTRSDPWACADRAAWVRITSGSRPMSAASWTGWPR